MRPTFAVLCFVIFAFVLCVLFVFCFIIIIFIYIRFLLVSCSSLRFYFLYAFQACIIFMVCFEVFTAVCCIVMVLWVFVYVCVCVRIAIIWRLFVSPFGVRATFAQPFPLSAPFRGRPQNLCKCQPFWQLSRSRWPRQSARKLLPTRPYVS